MIYAPKTWLNPTTNTDRRMEKPPGFGFIQCSATYALYGRDVVVVPEQLGSFRQGDLVSFQVKLEAGATKNRKNHMFLLEKLWFQIFKDSFL